MLRKKPTTLNRNFILSIFLLELGCLFSAIPSVGQANDTTAHSAFTEGNITPQQVANQANNPAAPLTQIQFRNLLLPNVSGTNGPANTLELQPVLPIGPFHSFTVVQLVKVTLSYTSLPSPEHRNGLSDLQIFDLFTFKEKWGRLGFGPALVFPTASDPLLGAGKWQAGPVVAIIFTSIKNLAAGVVVQNPISYAGDQNRAKQNNMIIAPTFTYNLKKGWFAGLSDFNWTLNWEDQGAATIPLGGQVGKIFSIGKETFSVSVEAGGFVASPNNKPNPGGIFGFELSQIFNFHAGPGEKIHLRGKKKGKYETTTNH